MDPALGIHLNPLKYELFNRLSDFKRFPPEMKTLSNLDISVGISYMYIANTVQNIMFCTIRDRKA